MLIREMDDTERAQRYRRRADEFRKIGDGLPDAESKGVLLSIALDYENMARLLEESDVSDAPVRALEALALLTKPDHSN